NCAVGDEFHRLDGAVGTTLYYCSATNTWTAVASSGGGGLTGSLTSGRIPEASGPTTLVDGPFSDSGTVVSTTEAIDLSAHAATVGDVSGTEIAPSVTSGTLNDWAPTGIGAATQIRIAPTGTLSITGIASGDNRTGRTIRIYNVSGQEVRLLNANSGSLTADRICGFGGAEVDLQ